MYLHKILNLPDKDPILQTYKEGLKFVYERNWANDVRELREKYGIALTDLEVSTLRNIKPYLVGSNLSCVCVCVFVRVFVCVFVCVCRVCVCANYMHAYVLLYINTV